MNKSEVTDVVFLENSKISKILIPIYDVTLYITICDNINKQRESFNNILGECNEDLTNTIGLLSYNFNNGLFGIFIDRNNDTPLKIVQNELFHCTQRILEYVNSRINVYNRESSALLFSYISDCVFNEIKKLDINFYYKLVNIDTKKEEMALLKKDIERI